MRSRFIQWRGGVLAAIFCAAGVVPVRAEERAAEPAVSMEALAEAIVDYTHEDAELKGGYFLVYDTVQKKPLMLELDKVHHDKLARLHKGEYFACADYKADDGTVYDLDVFMKGDSPETIQTTEVTVHKVDGKARYGWYQENGNWIKK